LPSCRQTSKPIPRLPPVTKAVRLVSLMMSADVHEARYVVKHWGVASGAFWLAGPTEDMI
jgi:hypothetical protein